MKVKLLIPPVQRYVIRYQTKDSQIKDYSISPPIEKNDSSFTAYSFTSKGIRTFKLSNILDIN